MKEIHKKQVEVFNERFDVFIVKDPEGDYLSAIYLDDHNLTYLLKEIFRDLIFSIACGKSEISNDQRCDLQRAGEERREDSPQESS